MTGNKIWLECQMMKMRRRREDRSRTDMKTRGRVAPLAGVRALLDWGWL